MPYTMRWEPLDECLHFVLNNTLRSPDRQQKIRPWYLFLRLFLGALFRLPSLSKTAYRGVKLDLSKRYIEGKTIVWWGFSSCTTTVGILQSELFLGTTNARTMFTLQCQSARDIRKHSYYQAEDEVLLMAATQFKVISYLNQDNLHIIQLEEIHPPFPLLQPVPIDIPPPINPICLVTPNIPVDARWAQNGRIIAGGHGRGYATYQFKSPFGLFVDDDQTMIIADASNHRIIQWKIGETNGQVVAGGNGPANQLDQLNFPTDMLIDKETNSLIICDRDNQRIVRWSRRSGTTHGEILIDNIFCWGLAMDDQRYLYISDDKKHEVRRYRYGGKTGTIVAGSHERGDGLNQLNKPRYLFVDRAQAVYVSDRDNHRVMKWNKGAAEGIVVAGGQGEGNALTQLSCPMGLFVDTLGTVYVVDSGNHRVMRWPKEAKQGTVIVGGNGRGEGANQLNEPAGLFFDRHGHLYVVDCSHCRVQRFSME
ncbi:unnamed protein product [Rotaria sp. Silwood1]|nr:unnamed protein product [Rotaria sp. Silwood1]